MGTMPLQAQTKLVFSSIVDFPAGYSILKEAYELLGINIAYEVYPAARALIQSNNGSVDGEVLRLAGIEQSYPNLIRVPVPIYYNEFVAFTKEKKFPFQGVESLKSYKVGTMRGMKIAEKILKGVTYTSLTKHEQIFKMIETGRLDVGVLPRVDTILFSKRLGVPVQILEPRLGKFSMYHYLHKKHSHLLPILTEILRKMEKSGHIEEVVTQFKIDIVSKD